jgi:hypothetical protein
MEEADSKSAETAEDSQGRDGVDQRGRLAEEVFAYRTSKDGKVFITWYGRQVKILKGPAAQRFLASIAGLDGLDAQLVMAKITGNFKHGNER